MSRLTHRGLVPFLALMGACTDLGDLDFSLFAASNGGQLSGAIFTTIADGTTVDANIYQAKCDVYLNGGPGPSGAAGLPEGDYYFMVTSPSGAPEDPPAVLLSSDAVENRLVTIDETGRFVSTSGTHAISSNDVDGGVTVQLCPYVTTPNPGCEYKAWLTPVDAYEPGAPGSTFGFVHSQSKTDNFKVCEEETPPPGEEGDGDGSEVDQVN